MTFLSVVFIIVIGAVIFNDLRKNKVTHKSKPTSNTTKKVIDEPHNDFLTSIEKKARDVSNAISQVKEDNQKTIKEAFSKDEERRSKLQSFAKKSHLDIAIIDVFKLLKSQYKFHDRLEPYSITECNLHQENNSRSYEKETITITFKWQNMPFTLIRRKQTSFVDNEIDYYFSIAEHEAEEVFKIKANMNTGPYSTFDDFTCQWVDVFKKKGQWADFLLSTWKILELKKEEYSNNSKTNYLKKIRENFTE